MDYREKMAYLKGLAEGLGLDDATKESRLIAAVIDTLDEVCSALSASEESVLSLGGDVDDLIDSVTTLEHALSHEGHTHSFEGDEEAVYEIVCPNCSEHIELDGDDLDQGGMVCPSCGEDLEFDMDHLDCPHCHGEQEE